ncbi:restriction endonuclease subunit S, partial [Escherichia coli]|nr:restriction endonuclease subunit S [Escherichia coli]
PVIKIKNVQSGKVTIADSQYVSTETVRKLDKFKLSDRDVLIAMTGQGSVGRVGRLSCEDGTTPYLNQRVGKFVADEEKLNIDYLYYVLST